MNYACRVSSVSLLVILVMLTGCKAKQETAESTAKSPDKAATAPAGAPAPGKPAASIASPTDMADARAAALRVLAQLERADFSPIYRDSAASFKQIGSEAAFVTKFQQTFQKTGPLTNPKELKFDTRPDNVHVLVYRVDNKRFITEMRLSFERSKNGAMELVGLNQHDEPRK